MPKPKRIRIDRLVLKQNVPAGMNPYVVLGMVPLMRNSCKHHAPIEVFKAGPKLYRIEDGRHRFMAAVMAGRTHVLCIEIEEPIE